MFSNKMLSSQQQHLHSPRVFEVDTNELFKVLHSSDRPVQGCYSLAWVCGQDGGLDTAVQGEKDVRAFGFSSYILPADLGSGNFLDDIWLPSTSTTSQEAKRDDWEVLFPSISLHDWNIQMMLAPSLRAAGDSKAGLMREAWLFAPERMEASVEGVWPTEWSSEGARLVKRNMVVADDAAFREKSKLLTSMERQKWLNSYMQKLLP
ncbi:hypothetical protein CRENBAI_010023 [Crenichthys baileyi]|uniref:Tuberoinfundibular peptide of 39 residues n=1 Tax=Crenichthys baileyi TaxID=28760 RepID=A0AAV9QLW0_9TELE